MIRCLSTPETDPPSSATFAMLHPFPAYPEGAVMSLSGPNRQFAAVPRCVSFRRRTRRLAAAVNTAAHAPVVDYRTAKVAVGGRGAAQARFRRLPQWHILGRDKKTPDTTSGLRSVSPANGAVHLCFIGSSAKRSDDPAHAVGVLFRASPPRVY
jgi:hypothetical protein